MIRGRIAKFLMLAIIVSMPMSTLAQKKFDVYGFMDFGFRKLYMEDNNFFQSLPWLSTNPNMTLGNINLYFDFKPNEYTRSLIEINLNSGIYDDDKKSGMSTYFSPSEAVIESQFYAGLAQSILAQDTTGFLDFNTAYAIAQGMGLWPGISAGILSANWSNEGGKMYGGVKVERAWLDITPFNFLNFRVGRFITPAGIWNVDHGSPLIVTIGQPNQTSLIPIFPSAQNGIMAYGSAFLGDHDLKYNLYISAGRDDGFNNDPSTESLTDFSGGGHLGVNLDILDGISAGFSGYSGKKKRIKLVGTNAIESATELTEPLLQGYTYEWVKDHDTREIALGGDFKASAFGFTLQSEYNYQLNKNLMDGKKETPIKGFYIMAAYDWTAHANVGVMPYFFFESLKWEKGENNPVEGLYNYPFEGWNQISGGINLRLFSNVRWKFEYNLALMDVLNDPVTPDGKINPMLQNTYTQEELKIKSVATEITIAF